MSGQATRLILPPLFDAPTPTAGIDSMDTATEHDTELIGMIEFQTRGYKDMVT